jgi:hypothetical protein
MECPKCGAKYNHKRDYCIKCGHIINNELVKKIEDNDSSSYLSYYFDEYKNGNELSSINFLYMFLPIPACLLYKCYYEAIIMIILVIHLIVSTLFIMNFVGIFGFFYIVFSSLAVLGYYIYNIFHLNVIRRKNALLKVESFIRDNKELSEEERIRYFEIDGQNNKSMFIGSLLIEIGLLILILIVLPML